ncbi:GntR family transcriptional regulator [Dethiobacter alkaliphilus]|uniref:GntR family transcriptional regulator n=1 Tax=Dethiobacter alkaliphilus TaxID=427926 RepID=UPI002225DED3|nr:GntR family transcriptional regulator [Dethiobacter alkaliphilus]MCW3490685.1 GntR family transcriptional regulator [Dethiobacter alkaliphilus]
MPWDFDSDRPIYLQLIEKIELMIFSGKYPPGAKLPSVRDIAKEAAVNPNTMQRALAKLEEDGLIITHRTSGRFITEDEKMIKKAKTRLAQEQTTEFFANMQKLGFDKTEVIAMVNQMLEKECKE